MVEGFKSAGWIMFFVFYLPAKVQRVMAKVLRIKNKVQSIKFEFSFMQ